MLGFDTSTVSSKPTRHRNNVSNSSNSSSEDASSVDSRQPRSWERLRRPSAASSTKRPQFNESNRSVSNFVGTASTLGRGSGKNDPNSPSAPFFPSHEMMRTASDDSYLHILAARKANQDSQSSDTSSILSFSCSLSKEFDRQQREVDGKVRPGSASTQPSSKKQAWLDSTFNKLSLMYRSKSGASAKNGNGDAMIKVKPHFLDLSAVICPVPAALDLKTPQAEEDRQLNLDSTTPRPSQSQRFGAAQSAHLASQGFNDMRLPSPPLLSPLTPSFALNALPNGDVPPQHHISSSKPMMQRSNMVTADDSYRATTKRMPAMSSALGARALRKQKSFENPSEIRRRQKQEWTITDENSPTGLTIGIPKQSEYSHPRQQHLNAPSSHPHPHPHQQLQRRQQPSSQGRSRAGSNASTGGPPLSPISPISPPLPLHAQVSSLMAAARPAPMQRGISHDTASRQMQRTSPPRPTLGSRTSSSALRYAETFDPTSSTGFSIAHSSSERPPPLLSSSRESYGSSTGSESQPQTPVSATYLRSLPYVHPNSPPRNLNAMDEKEYIRELSHDQKPHQHQQPFQHQHHHQLPLGSALGLMPGMMVRAYSDSPSQVSRLRPGSDSSNGSLGDEYPAGISNIHRTPRASGRHQQAPQRPPMRREHTVTSATTSPAASRPLELAPVTAPSTISTTPRSSSLKDLHATATEPATSDANAPIASGPQRSVRTSISSHDSENSDSSLAYTKPSPNPEYVPPQRSDSTRSASSQATSTTAFPYSLEREDSQATGMSITPTNSHPGELNVSKWSPSTPPSHINNRARANSRADEWAANLRKLTRGTAAK